MNTSELRKILIEDLRALRSGTLTPSAARARAALVKSLLDTVKLELLFKAMNQPPVHSLNLADETIVQHDDDGDDAKVVSMR